MKSDREQLMSDQSWDQAMADTFGERMLDILNSAAIALMTSIGHQVGLFDTIASQPAMTCQQIAQAAGLQERYVREWLGVLVTGRVIDLDPVAQTYTLPPERAAWLTRAAGVNNLANDAQIL